MNVFSGPPESPPILSPTEYREQVFIWEVCGSCHPLVPDYKTRPFHYDMVLGGSKRRYKEERWV